MKCKLTIFTPTYNRANLIDKLYKSLTQQTNKNFVWLIVDDGSTDNTQKVIKKYSQENKININYVVKENGGKHSAMDLAHSICETEYIACVDSDDYLLENAVENIYSCINKINKDDCVGILGKKFSTSLKALGEGWPTDGEYIKFYELGQKYGYKADTFLIFKTDIVKQFRFPKIEGEKFVTEKVLYNQFMFDHTLFVTSTVDYVADYQSDGYTSGALRLLFNNKKSCLYAFKSDAYYFTKYGASIKDVVFAWARFYAWRRLNKFKNLYSDELNIKTPKKIWGWAMSFIFYFRYKKKYKMFKAQTKA